MHQDMGKIPKARADDEQRPTMAKQYHAYSMLPKASDKPLTTFDAEWVKGLVVLNFQNIEVNITKKHSCTTFANNNSVYFWNLVFF